MDWSGENILPYVETILHNIVSYTTAKSIVWLVLFSISFICGIFCIKYLIKHPKFGTYERYSGYIDDDARGFAWVISIGIIFVSILIIVCNILTIIKCKTFPELVMFEEMTELLKTLQ